MQCNKCGGKEKFGGKKVFWFEPMSIAKLENAKYYAGSYLEAVQTILFFMAFISLIPLVVSAYNFYSSGKIILAIIFLVVFAITITIIMWRISRIRARRKILEGGLLSIHSCGILWEAVIIAHKMSIMETIEDNKMKLSKTNLVHLYDSYTSRLSRLAVELSDNICDIHIWIEKIRGKINNAQPRSAVDSQGHATL